MRPTRFLVVDPAHFEVSYAINPWMKPAFWNADPIGMRRGARRSFAALTRALRATGARVETLQGIPGAPDLVFPANAAVVLDGRAIMARFRHPERRIEEPVFHAALSALQSHHILREVATLPKGCFQEGAGDFIWDAGRALFWTGQGPRSSAAGTEAVADFFGQETIDLNLATEQFYHLDTCFCPLPGGEILYYPPAFSSTSQRLIKDRVPSWQLIEASDEDAARFCVNAVCVDRTIIMAKAADPLKRLLSERGYRVEEVDLAPFILSGGGAYCMTLRLDRQSVGAETRPLVMAAQPL